MPRYKRYLILFCYFFAFLSNKIEAQTTNCTINGSFVRPFKGKVYLLPAIADKNYYKKNAEVDSANVYNGKFVINRNVYDNNIYAYRIAVRSHLINGITNLIFLSPKNQVIIIDSVNEYVSPILKNSPIQNEMKYTYDKFFEPFIQEVNSLESYAENLYKSNSGNITENKRLKIASLRKELSKRGDSLFLQYAKEHSDSYVTLWKLIERFKNIGYKKEYLETYNLLSVNIKRTPAATTLLHDLWYAKNLGLGSNFPRLQLKTKKQNKIIVDFKKNNKAMYILVDFWFSNCAPCLREFAMYKLLYKEYKVAGFEIVGVSVDKKDDFKKWQKVTEENGLNWINYWDEDGLLSKKLSINSFPTNFLLNKKGEIIKKNISPQELQNLLAQHIKIIDNIDQSVEPL